MKSVRNTKQETLTVCMAIGVVAGSVISASAQQQQDRGMDRQAIGQQEPSGQRQRQQPEKRPAAMTNAQQRGMQQGGSLQQLLPMARASKLLDMEVHGQDGQKLGDVDEIILSQDRRRVEHIKVSLDCGGSVNLSLSELSAKRDDDDVLLVRTSTQQLQQRQDKAQARVGRAQDEQASRRVSTLIGLDVQGTDGKNAGSISDLIIDTKSGQIKTAALKTGGFLGLGTRLASVEWQQVTVAAEGGIASINMPTDSLSEQAQKPDAYWQRHAYEGVDGQYEPGVQQPGAKGQPQGKDMDQRRRSGTTNGTTKADNTGRNVRDRKDATLTSFDQGNSKADTDTTAQIRKVIHDAEHMSVNGKNVKIITRDGQVTLRGPVASEEEKRIIGEIANRIARDGNVDNQLEVKSDDGQY